jgi:hypothetical protein
LRYTLYDNYLKVIFRKGLSTGKLRNQSIIFLDAIEDKKENKPSKSHAIKSYLDKSCI